VLKDKTPTDAMAWKLALWSAWEAQPEGKRLLRPDDAIEQLFMRFRAAPSPVASACAAAPPHPNRWLSW
jgi:hypothetical protein